MSIEKTRAVLAKSELSDEDIVHLLSLQNPDECRLLQEAAFARTTELMGNYVYYRGLIEFSNICTASCRYCGIRRENHDVKRYTMDIDEIVEAAVWAANQGYGSVCLQSGERRDEKFIAYVEEALERIHAATVSPERPEGVGITLSLGQQTLETYRRWAKASLVAPRSYAIWAALKPRTRSSLKSFMALVVTTKKNSKIAFRCSATYVPRATKLVRAS